MCDSIANGGPRAVACPPCPPANVIIASNVLDTTGNVIAGNIIAVDGTFTGNLYVAGNIVSNISYSILNVTGPINGASIWGTSFFGNGYGLSNLNASNITGTISNTNLPPSGVVAGTYGSFANVSQVTVDQYGLVTAASNVAILSSQWTTVAGNVAYQNGVSVGTLSAPPVGSNLYVLGSANITDTLNVSTLYVNSATVFGSATLNVFGVSNLSTVLASLYTGNGSGISNINSSNLVGNVASANVALVVSQPAQPNITSLGVLNSLSINGLLIASNASGLSNVNASNLVGNVANANVALVVSQPAQPNVTSLGTLTGLTINGLLVASNASGLSNVNASNLVGNVANANVALVVSQPAQPNVTSLGTLTGLVVSGVLQASLLTGNGSGISNLNSSNLVGNVAQANVAMVVSQPAQPNVTSLGTLTGLVVSGILNSNLFTGNGSGISNLNSSNLVGNVANANVAMVVSQPSQPNITSVGTLTSLTVSGSVTGGTFYGSGAGLTNIPISNLSGTVNYANTAGSVVNPAQPNITSVGALTTLSVIGSLIAGTISGDGQGLYSIPSSAIVGTVATANSVIQPAQPNITSVGSLTGLTVNGLLRASNGSGISNLNASNLAFGTLSTGVLPTSGVTSGMYGSGANVSQVTIDQYGRVTTASNVPIVASQWTSVAGNVAYQNGVSIGTLSAPPIGSNLYVLGTATIGNIVSNGSALSSLPASNIEGTVPLAESVSLSAQPNITSVGTASTKFTINGLLVASNASGLSNVNGANVSTVPTSQSVIAPSQPNITSVGTLTGLTIQGRLIASNGSGISNINSSNLVGNVANANVALVVSQAAQPNITSVNQAGRAFTVNGLLIASNASGLSNINSSNLVGNVARANVALVVSQPAQPNITSVGILTSLNVSGETNTSSFSVTSAITANATNVNILFDTLLIPNITVSTGLTVQGLLIASNGSGISNLNSSNLVGNVANANVALVVSQPAQPNITSLGVLNSLSINGLLIASNGSGISNLNSSNLVGNVANSNVALVVSQPAQPNVTSLGTLTGLTIDGLLIASNGSGISNLNSSNLVGNVANANVALVVSQPAQPNITSVGTLTGLTIDGLLVASNGSGISNLNSSNLIGNVANANTALVVTQPAQPNITSVGTLTGLTINGLLIASNGSGISNLNSSNLVGNVANSNVALVVSQPAQPNVTSLGTLTGLTIDGLLIASNGSGISNLNSSNLVGNVANANVAMVVSQPAQPNVTSLGTLTGLTINGLLIASNGSGISNLNSSNLVGNVANANVALVVSQPAQPNITSVGTLTGLTIDGLLIASNGSGISNLNSSNLVGNVANANVALVVSQPAQPNITSIGTLSSLNVSGVSNLTAIWGSLATPDQPNVTSLGNLISLTTGNLTVTSNILPGTIYGNTYLDGNIIVSGNVFSALGMPLGSGGGYYFSLPSDITLQVPYTGALYGVTYPLSVGLSNGFTINGTSTLITVTPNGNFQFSVAGPYMLRAVFNSTDNITGLAVGSNVADIHGTDQDYMYRYTTFITQNPTELIEIPFNVTDTSKYYYLDLFSTDGGVLKATATSDGGTYLAITPLQGGGLATGGPGGTPGTQWINSGSNIYFSNSVGIGAVNPQYKLDVSGDLRVTGNIYGNVFGATLYSVVTGLTSNYTALTSDYYIGVNGARKVTLPLGSSIPIGKSYVVKDEAGNASVTSVLLQASGSDIIDGNSNITMALNNISLTTLWTGTRWSLI